MRPSVLNTKSIASPNIPTTSILTNVPNSILTSGGPTNPQFRQTSAGNTGNAGQDGGHSHNMSANFSGDATSVIQPYLTVIYIIKT